MIKVLIPTTKRRRNILYRCMENCVENAGIDHEIVVYENDVGYVKALLTMINGCKDEDVVVLLNDDILFGKDWLYILNDSFLGVELVQSREMNNPESSDLAVTPMGYAGWFKKYAHSGYHHNFIDKEWTDIAKARGSYLYVPDSHIYHEHWSFGKSDRDDVYLEQMKWFELDKNLYNERFALSNGFKDLDKLE
jgi:hypothetical protein